MAPNDERRQLEHLRQEVLRKRGDLPVARMNAAFAKIVSGLTGAPIRIFVPVLARRCLRQELSDGR